MFLLEVFRVPRHGSCGVASITRRAIRRSGESSAASAVCRSPVAKLSHYLGDRSTQVRRARPATRPHASSRLLGFCHSCTSRVAPAPSSFAQIHRFPRDLGNRRRVLSSRALLRPGCAGTGQPRPQCRLDQVVILRPRARAHRCNSSHSTASVSSAAGPTYARRENDTRWGVLRSSSCQSSRFSSR